MQNDLKAEEKTASTTSSPGCYSVPSPKDFERCKGCPYPGVGFICWNTDGTCMRTDEQRLSRRGEGR